MLSAPAPGIDRTTRAASVHNNPPHATQIDNAMLDQLKPTSTCLFLQWTKPAYRYLLVAFYSTYISGAQRLPNGNTLICEGVPGRIFEVTPQAEIVWEYINPHFADALAFGTNNAVFRAFRYGPELFPQLG